MKRSTPNLRRHVDQLLRAEHVVLHRLAGAQLHQRHVLVRGGVKYDVRWVPREHSGQAAGVADVAHERVDVKGWPSVLQFIGYRKQRVLVPLIEQQRSSAPARQSGGTTQTRWTRPRRSPSHSARQAGDATAPGPGRLAGAPAGLRSPVCGSATTSTLPLTISLRLGSVRILSWNGCSARTTSRITAGGADGIAISTSSGSDLARSLRARSARLPSTGTPCICSPCLPGSSSTKPIGLVVVRRVVQHVADDQFARHSPHLRSAPSCRGAHRAFRW